jgi:uncharacterized repeat protein (TIGR01451 family)
MLNFKIMKYLLFFLTNLCFIMASSQDRLFDARFMLSEINCDSNKVCYDIQVRAANEEGFNLAGQNWRIFWDGSKASYLSGVSLLPTSKYSPFTLTNIFEDVNATGFGPLPFEANLSFLNFFMDLTDIQNGGVSVNASEWLTCANLCFEISQSVLDDPDQCLEMVFARDGLTNTYGTAFVQIAAWLAAFQTGNTAPNEFFDLDSDSGDAACFNESCGINQSDLKVSKYVNKFNPAVGDTLVFSVLASNNGPQNATNVQVSEQLNASYFFLSSQASQGNFDPNSGIWSIGTLDKDSSAILEISVLLTAEAGSNTVSISGTELDPDLSNNVYVVDPFNDNYQIRMVRANFECNSRLSCYSVELKALENNNFNLASQSYAIFWNGALASFQNINSFLDTDFYSSPQNIRLFENEDFDGIGPLPYDANLSFLIFDLGLIDSETGGQLLASDEWLPTASVCFQLDESLLFDSLSCLQINMARFGLTQNYSNSFTEVKAWSEENSEVERNASATEYYDIEINSEDACFFSAIVEASISGNLNICVGESTELTASEGASYLWSNGSEESSITVAPGTTTSYSVTVTNASGCTGEASVSVNVSESTSVSISGNLNICVGESTELTASEGASYLWSTGSEESSITVAPGTTTSYSVTVTNASGCTSEASVSVNVSESVTVNISGNLNICVGESTELTASEGASYLWSTGSEESSITVAPGTTTSYSVTVTNASGCTGEASVSVNVSESVTVNISGNLNICVGESTELTASEGASYLWSNGFEGQSITVNPNAMTTYSVTVTNASGCTGEASVSVNVSESVTVNISGNLNICVGESTELTASEGASYLWSTGSEESSITVAPGTTTSYSVTVTNASGCTGEASVSVNVSESTSVSISGNLNICVGESTELTASEGASYLWSNGFEGQSITVNPNAMTTYSVTVTNASGCTGEASVSVNVSESVTVNISGNLNICVGESTELTASEGASYLWSTGSEESSITVAPGTTTSYSVTVTNASGCTGEASVSVNVSESTSVSISGNLNICVGESTELTASEGASYLWSNGFEGQSITVNPNAMTTYSVTVTNASGCTGEASVSVNVSESVTVNISGNPNICFGESTELTASEGASYLWSNGFEGQSITVNPNAMTTYSVTVTNASGCTGEASVSVNVSESTSVSISGNLNICVGESTELTASEGASYLWSTGSEESSITVAPGTTTSYSVTVTNASGCTGEASVSVNVSESVTVSISGNLNICVGESTELTASEGASYLWSTGSEESSITVAPGTTTSYSVTVTNASGCTGEASVSVNVSESTSVSISGNLNICVGESTELTASEGASYLWSNGFEGQSITVNPNVMTTYSVTVTNASGCTGEASVSVNVTECTLCDLFDCEIKCTNCPGEFKFNSFQVEDSLSVLYMLINRSGIIVNITQDTIMELDERGVFFLFSIIYDESYNVEEIQTGMSLDNLPLGYLLLNEPEILKFCTEEDIEITPDQMICAGDEIILTVSDGIAFEWNTGEQRASIVVSPDEDSFYSVVIGLPSGCLLEKETLIEAMPSPELKIQCRTKICVGETIRIATISGAINYEWSTGARTRSILVSPIETFTYWVTVTNEFGCQAVDSITIRVEDCEQKENIFMFRELVENSDKFDVQVYPNPSYDYSTIEISGSSNKDTEIRIFDANGSMVRILKNPFGIGDENQNIIVRKLDLRAGLYYIHIQREGNSKILKWKLID